jgi:HK97 family phage major capsid protein
MSTALKQHMVEKHGLAQDADDAALKSLVKEKMKSGDLDPDTYAELLTAKSAPAAKDKADELADSIAQKTAGAVATALGPALSQLTEVLKSRNTPPAASAASADELPEETPEQTSKQLADMEARLIKRFKDEQLAVAKSGKSGNDGAALMAMAFDDQSSDGLRIKGAVERYSHAPTALVYKSPASKLLGCYGEPMQYNNKEVNKPTERTTAMNAVWLKLQVAPELLSERDMDIVRHILHREKFHVPNAEGNTEARLLTEQERHDVLESHLKFYSLGFHKGTTVINDTTSGGQYATPEFFDMDFIVSPTLASENIPSFCNVVPVARGAAAQNFRIGRPTLAANTEGSPVTLFTTDGFLVDHDTSFFRVAGFTSFGINFAQDAHPGVVPETMNQYMNSFRLWLNTQITSGDGTTEPQGIKVASGTVDITPTTPTTGPIVLADVLEMLFGVPKAYRENGGRQNAIYIMQDSTYHLVRSIATGVTGDTRLVFGDDVESYRLFNHPVLIEEGGLANDEMIFAQMRGYRIYMRQSPRFIREDRGDTLVRSNTFIVGMDARVGGRLDEGSYAAVADGFIP